MTQFDKDDVEAIGLVKFDFLGLTTLTILDCDGRYIVARSIRRGALRRSRRCRWTTRRPTSSSTDGHTTAVFQFESRGMRELLKRRAAGRASRT